MLTQSDKEINRRIKYYRTINFYTQADLAEKLDMKLSTYSQKERMGVPTVKFLNKVAEALNIDVNLLIYGEAAPNPPKPPVSPDVVPPVAPKTGKINPDPPELTFSDLKNTEQNIIKILRHLEKDEYKRICGIILETYNNSRNKCR